MKLKKDDLVEIYWLDILSVNSWENEKQAMSINAANCKSVGYFLNIDKKAIRISSCIGTDSVNGEERDVTIIPQGCITKIRKLK